MRETLVPAAWVMGLMIPGVLAFQPTFGESRGWLPGAAGVLIGVLIGVASAWLGWGLLVTVLALLGAYFLFGGVIALPQTTIYGVVPSVDTLHRLTLLVVQSWRDLLTVATPAGDFLGPAVVPWLGGLLFGCLATIVAARTNRPLLTLLSPLAWLVLGIGFGVRDVPAATLVGALFGVVGLAWLVWVQATVQQDSNEELLVNSRAQKNSLLRRVGLAAMILALASGVSVYAAAATSERTNRQVLRDYVAPPLKLADYPTPLAKYRLYETDLKDEVLMSVTGMPKDARLRIATMDTYNGIVYNVSRTTADYVRVGRRIGGQPREGAAASVTIDMATYNDIWLPLVGTVQGIRFDSDQQLRLADGLYFNKETNSSLTTARVGEGDTVTLDVTVAALVTSADKEKLAGRGAGQLLMPKASGVPDILGSFAGDVVADEPTAFDQLSALEAVLRKGFYSDGSGDSQSRSGHNNDRLTRMFTENMLIGDDEQYATAMALMASQLGIPSRVVMGFYPEPGDVTGNTWEVTGTQGHVWVESYLDTVGWVVFDPTPPRDRIPKTQLPKPKPKPKPMVEPPPNPPDQPAEEPNLNDEDAQKEDGDPETPGWVRYLLIAAASVAGLGLVSSPFALILLLKCRRRTARRTDLYLRGRFAGGWDEITDRARDLGVSHPDSYTRRESARVFHEAFAGVEFEGLAERLDMGTFAAQVPSEGDATQAWDLVDEARTAMALTVPWHRRLRGRFALGSLAHPAHERHGKATPGGRSRLRGFGRKKGQTE